MTRKVFFLGSLGIHKSLAIADPYGEDLRNFEQTYDKIARLIDGAVATVNAANAVARRRPDHAALYVKDHLTLS